MSDLYQSVRVALLMPVEPRPRLFVSGTFAGPPVRLKSDTADWWFLSRAEWHRLKKAVADDPRLILPHDLHQMIEAFDLDRSAHSADPAVRAAGREIVWRLARWDAGHADWENFIVETADV